MAPFVSDSADGVCIDLRERDRYHLRIRDRGTTDARFTSIHDDCDLSRMVFFTRIEDRTICKADSVAKSNRDIIWSLQVANERRTARQCEKIPNRLPCLVGLERDLSAIIDGPSKFRCSDTPRLRPVVTFEHGEEHIALSEVNDRIVVEKDVVLRSMVTNECMIIGDRRLSFENTDVQLLLRSKNEAVIDLSEPFGVRVALWLRGHIHNNNQWGYLSVGHQIHQE